LKKKATENSFLHGTSYPGGIKALREYIETNLKYPEEAVKNAIGGIVSIMFDIDKNGKVSNTKVKHGIGYGCDEEALRLVKSLRYSSTKNRGLFVVFHETINITFNLQGYLKKFNEENLKRQAEAEAANPTPEPAQPQGFSINYTVTNKDEKPAINYTIKLN
jgi:TonB family protein